MQSAHHGIFNHMEQQKSLCRLQNAFLRRLQQKIKIHLRDS